MTKNLDSSFYLPHAGRDDDPERVQGGDSLPRLVRSRDFWSVRRRIFEIERQCPAEARRHLADARELILHAQVAFDFESNVKAQGMRTDQKS